MIDAFDNQLGGVGAAAVENSRLCRARRYAAVCQLSQLASNAERSVASAVMDILDNDDLDKLPDWCLMDDAGLQEFQHLAGALFFAPALMKCIDGHHLAKWNNLVGDALLDCIVNVRFTCAIENLQAMPQVLPEAEGSLLLAKGASILWSTLIDHAAQPLLRNRFVEDVYHINTELALEVHDTGLVLFRQGVKAAGVECAQGSYSLSSPARKATS